MKRPQKYTGIFRYGPQRHSFSFWQFQDDVSPVTPDTIVFLGAGQVDRIPRWVALAAGSGVVVVEGLPHWKAHPSGKDIAAFAEAYVQAAFEAVQQTFGGGVLHVIAESQAVPACVSMVCKLTDTVGNVVLVRPLGFTAHAFGSTDRARLRAFRKRLFLTALQLMHQPRNIMIGIIMVRAMLREPSLAALIKKYTVGISHDLLQDYKNAAKLQHDRGRSLIVLVGKKDRLFPPDEIIAALQASSIEVAAVRIMPKIGHASFATPSSKSVLKHAISLVRQKDRDNSSTDC